MFLQRPEVQKHRAKITYELRAWPAQRREMPAVKRKAASRKAKPKTTGLEAADCRLDSNSADIRDVIERVEKEGGSIIGTFRDPFGGSSLVLAVLPIDAVEPTPFQRDLSEAHHKKLSAV